MDSFLTFLQSLPSLASTNTNVSPVLLGLIVLDVYLIFYVTRDALLRIRPFFPQLLCILLVAALPGVGFLLYILVRPARLIKERELEEMLLELLDRTETIPPGDEEPEPETAPPPSKQQRPTEGRLIAAASPKKAKKKPRERDESTEDEGGE